MGNGRGVALDRALLALRVSAALFLLQWGVEKIFVPESAAAFWQERYGLAPAPLLSVLFGILEITIAGSLLFGRFRTLGYGAAVAVQATSVLASWRELVAPWAAPLNHLYIAELVVLAVLLALFFLRRWDRPLPRRDGDAEAATPPAGADLERALHRALLVLRVGAGLFLLQWGAEKFVQPTRVVGIWERFYGIDVVPLLGFLFGAGEILIAACLVLGLLRTPAYGAALVVHAVTVAVTWRQLLDPWSEPWAHLFGAAIPVLGALLALFLLRHWDRPLLPATTGFLGAKTTGKDRV